MKTQPPNAPPNHTAVLTYSIKADGSRVPVGSIAASEYGKLDAIESDDKAFVTLVDLATSTLLLFPATHKGLSGDGGEAIQAPLPKGATLVDFCLHPVTDDRLLVTYGDVADEDPYRRMRLSIFFIPDDLTKVAFLRRSN